MSPIIVTLVILGLAVIAFMSNRVPMGIVALGVALSLWATGILTLNQALAGFGDPTVCLLYTSPSPRDGLLSRMPSSA